MENEKRSHWRAMLGFGFVGFGGFWRIVGIGGSIDFLLSRWKEPGWVGKMLGAIGDPPNWLTVPLILVGLALIYWDRRLTRRTSAPATTPPPPPEDEFPPAHAEACRKLARDLGKLRGMAVTSHNWARKNLKFGVASYIVFGSRLEAASELAATISYDKKTYPAVRRYISLAAGVVQFENKKKNSAALRAELEAMTPPLFEALQRGLPVNPSAIPSRQLPADIEAKIRL